VSDGRRSGILVPLFSLTSSRSWGIGEFLDVPAFGPWMREAGQSLIQILPITEIPDAETSPYSALTAMALDPIYISLPVLDDFQSLGGESILREADSATLVRVRSASRIDYQAVRSLKGRWLRRCYAEFSAAELPISSERARRFEAFTRDESWWLDDYALFQAIRDAHALRAWWEWPEPLARRDPRALLLAREEHASEISYRKYVQWVAAEQWTLARRDAQRLQIFGDLPFMISTDSSDVWARQNEFRFDATVGVPPDAFSETGQDWGLPPRRWDVMAQNGYEWMKQRARRTAALFDGFRIDHLVGLYRTYIRPRDPTVRPFFAPPDEATQAEVGERLVRIYQDTGAEIVAEDLGSVPDFVRASLQRLAVPGFKVLRWERQWSVPGQPFIDPLEYAETSVATTGTHDIEPLACWWEELTPEERAQVLEIPALRHYLRDGDISTLQTVDALSPELNDAFLRMLLDSGSRLTIIPVQDVFGWRDRINTPATVNEENWTWRMPWRVDHLLDVDEPRRRARSLAEWTQAAGR